MLQVDINLDVHRLAKPHDLKMENINEVTNNILNALKDMEKDKVRVARAYNKKIKSKSFLVTDIVWKTILLIGSKSNRFVKW